MGLFQWLFSGATTHESSNTDVDDDTVINPANGLPMVGGRGGMDIEGNMYGFDDSEDDGITGNDMFDDDWL